MLLHSFTFCSQSGFQINGMQYTLRLNKEKNILGIQSIENKDKNFNTLFLSFFPHIFSLLTNTQRIYDITHFAKHYPFKIEQDILLIYLKALEDLQIRYDDYKNPEDDSLLLDKLFGDVDATLIAAHLSNNELILWNAQSTLIHHAPPLAKIQSKLPSLPSTQCSSASSANETPYVTALLSQDKQQLQYTDNASTIDPYAMLFPILSALIPNKKATDSPFYNNSFFTYDIQKRQCIFYLTYLKTQNVRYETYKGNNINEYDMISFASAVQTALLTQWSAQKKIGLLEEKNSITQQQQTRTLSRNVTHSYHFYRDVGFFGVGALCMFVVLYMYKQ